MDDLIALVAADAKQRGIERTAAIRSQFDIRRLQWDLAMKMAPKPCAYCGGIPPRCCHSSHFTSRDCVDPRQYNNPRGRPVRTAEERRKDLGL